MRNTPISQALLLTATLGFIACVGQSPCEQGSGEDCIDEADEASLNRGAADGASSSSRAQDFPSDNMSYGNLFQGGEINFNVHSGFEEDEFAGHWYVTNDNEIGGKSSVTFPVPLNSPENFDENISYCGGFCDTVKVIGNISTPYAGVGFNLVNKDAKGADITAWGGIVIDYVASHHPLTVALVPEGVTDFRQFYHYDLPACPGHRALRWSEFVQVDEGQHKRNKEEDLKHIAAMQFVVGGKSGDVTYIKINSLGTYYLREGEVPHEFVPASSSFYMEPKSSESISSSSEAFIDVSVSSSAISSSSALDYSSAAYSSSVDFGISSSAVTEISSAGISSSSNTFFTGSSSSANTFTTSSSEIPSLSSSSSIITEASSSSQQWTDFNGGWGGWGGF